LNVGWRERNWLSLALPLGEEEEEDNDDGDEDDNEEGD
jgi:hypothetical protein